MNAGRSNELLLSVAIIEGRADDAEKYLRLLRKEYGKGSKAAILYFHEARILFIRKQIERGLAVLDRMRRNEGSPFGTSLFLKALCTYRVDKKRALKLLEEFKAEVASYEPRTKNELQKSYYEIQLTDLAEEIRVWSSDHDHRQRS